VGDFFYYFGTDDSFASTMASVPNPLTQPNHTPHDYTTSPDAVHTYLLRYCQHLTSTCMMLCVVLLSKLVYGH